MQLVFQKLANIFEKNRNLSLTSNQKLAMTDQKQHAESRNIVSKELHHQKRSLSSNVLGKNQMTSYCNAPYMDAKSHRSDHKEGFDQGAFVSMFAYQTLDDRRRQKTKGLTPVDSIQKPDEQDYHHERYLFGEITSQVNNKSAAQN